MRPRLSVADLVEIAASVLGCEPAEAVELVDLDRAGEVLRRAAGHRHVASQVGALLHGLLTDPVVRRGARRVAVVAGAHLAELHGCRLELEPPEEARDFVAEVRSGGVEVEKVMAWVAGRLRSSHDLREERMMFERFTDRARRVVVLAQEEARLLDHNSIGTEHLLLGLIREGEGVGAKALDELGISGDKARQRVLEIIGRGADAPPSGHIPFTPRSKKVMELAFREALQLGHNYIGTEHLLLALLREGKGVGAQVLVSMGVSVEDARAKVVHLLQGYTPKPKVIEGALCPGCGRRLRDTLRSEMVDIESPPGRAVVLYCGGCGRTIGPA